MRKIKFRIWNGSVMMCPGTEPESVGLTLSGRAARFWDNETPMLLGDDVMPIAMQYTGIKDKNGNEIYEGDVLAHTGIRMDASPRNVHVRWDSNNCFWRGYWSQEEGTSLNNFHQDKYEVIGNIYEDPSLIETLGN